MRPPLSPSLSRTALAWVTLAGLGLRARHADAVQRAGGPQRALARGPAGLSEVIGRRAPRRLLEVPAHASLWEEARKHAARVGEWASSGGSVLTPGAVGRVARTPGAPLVAFLRGDVDLLDARPSLGIVGSRDASPRGLRRAYALARDASAHGALVVSGGARGIDLEAHRGAVAAGGRTLAVLGDPVRGAADERPARVCSLAERGGVTTLTPHGPWTPMTSRLWVARNAVLAALCDVVVVIEGRAKSGTRHTAEAAVALGVPLLVVPGDPDEDLARTPNALLRLRGAQPLVELEDALGLLFGARSPRAPPADSAGQRQPSLPLDLSPGAREVLLAVHGAGGAASPDELATVIGRPAASVLGDSFELELRGLVTRCGPRFCLA